MQARRVQLKRFRIMAQGSQRYRKKSEKKRSKLTSKAKQPIRVSATQPRALTATPSIQQLQQEQQQEQQGGDRGPTSKYPAKRKSYRNKAGRRIHTRPKRYSSDNSWQH